MTKKTIAAVVISCFLFFACSKQRKYERMVEGEKIIESYFVDGADSLTWLVDSVIRCSDYYIEFHSLRSKERPAGIDLIDISGCASQSGGYIAGGSWYLKDKQKTLSLTVSIDGWFILPTEWNVMSLNSTEMWLETESGNKSYEIRFKTR